MNSDKSTSRRLFSRLFFLIFSAAITLLPFGATAETKFVYPSPHIDYVPGGSSNIHFAQGSSSLSDEAKKRLLDQIPCINSLHLQAFFVVVFHDVASQSYDNEARAVLSASRADSIIKFLEDMGVSERKIFTETRKPQQSSSSDNLSGVASWEYIGQCAKNFADCRKACSRHVPE